MIKFNLKKKRGKPQPIQSPDSSIDKESPGSVLVRQIETENDPLELKSKNSEQQASLEPWDEKNTKSYQLQAVLNTLPDEPDEKQYLEVPVDAFIARLKKLKSYELKES